MSSRGSQGQPLHPLQRCSKSGRNLPRSPRTGVGLGQGAAGGHPLGLFFLYGLGQILPVLWVLVSPSAVELIIPVYNFPPAQGHAWASVLVPTIRTRTFSEKDGDAWGSPYDLLFLALSLPLGSRCLLGPQRPGPASRPGRGL